MDGDAAPVPSVTKQNIRGLQSPGTGHIHSLPEPFKQLKVIYPERNYETREIAENHF